MVCPILVKPALPQKIQRAPTDCRQGQKIYFKRNYLGRECGSDVGTDDRGYGLREGHYPGIDETDHHHGGCATALNQYGNNYTCENGNQRVGRQSLQNAPQFVSRRFLHPRSHHLYPHKKKPQASDQAEDQIQPHVCFYPSGMNSPFSILHHYKLSPILFQCSF